jgi:hypothetical protein
MWVVPLALYLATFVIVFSRRPILRHEWMVAIEPFFIVALVGAMVFEIRDIKFGSFALNTTNSLFVLVALHAVTFFVITMVCHGELSRSRPAAQYLTGFYMWMSAGGVIGGIFAGLVAPNVFSWVLEYPALIALAILCRPGLEMPTTARTRLLWLGAVAIVAIVAFPRPDRALRHRREDLQLDDRRDARRRGPRVARGAAVLRGDCGGAGHRPRLPPRQRRTRDDAQLLRRTQDHRDVGR